MYIYIYIYSYTYMCAHPQKLSFSMTSLITEIYTYWNGPREVSLRGPVLYVQKFIGSAVSNTSYFHVGVFDSLCLKWFAEPPTLEMYILCLHIILYIHDIYEYIYTYHILQVCRYLLSGRLGEKSDSTRAWHVVVVHGRAGGRAKFGRPISSTSASRQAGWRLNGFIIYKTMYM